MKPKMEKSEMPPSCLRRVVRKDERQETYVSTRAATTAPTTVKEMVHQDHDRSGPIAATSSEVNKISASVPGISRSKRLNRQNNYAILMGSGSFLWHLFEEASWEILAEAILRRLLQK